MSIIYEPADDEVKDIVAGVLKKHHKDLAKAGVTVGVLMATAPKDDAGFPTKDAVKLHGYPAAAVIRIVPYKQRVKGIEDSEITIDSDWWKDAHADERAALIDHELTHLELKRDEDGMVKTDDHQRPKLKMRLHDAELGVFKEIIERHGAAAVDAKVSRKFVAEFGQLLIDFASESGPRTPKAVKAVAV